VGGERAPRREEPLESGGLRHPAHEAGARAELDHQEVVPGLVGRADELQLCASSQENAAPEPGQYVPVALASLRRRVAHQLEEHERQARIHPLQLRETLEARL
jgi:hypothetical protein